MTSPHNRLHIKLQLRDLSQLFNSMDPSPFFERDLDADAEEYILSWVREADAHREIQLVIHLKTTPDQDLAERAEEAVRHYFNERAGLKSRELRLLLRRGRTSLFIGLAFMIACLLLASVLSGMIDSERARTIVSESLTIGGWVAMWRPLEIYLYDWWPVRDELRTLKRLGRLHVKLEQSADRA